MVAQNLVRARQSAQAACEKGNFAGAASLSILAAVYAAQGNFDRAEFYQKLAVIFATDVERPKILETLEDYRADTGARLGEETSQNLVAPRREGRPLRRRPTKATAERTTEGTDRQGAGAPKFGMVF